MGMGRRGVLEAPLAAFSMGNKGRPRGCILGLLGSGRPACGSWDALTMASMALSELRGHLFE